MIRNTKYIATFNLTNKSIEQNQKDIYESSISKRDDYLKTNQYVFILTIHDSIEVYQLLKIESKYPKKFYKGDTVECKEHGRGIIICVKKESFTKLEVQFDNGVRDSYTYSGYKFPARERNNPRNRNPFAYDKLVKI